MGVATAPSGPAAEPDRTGPGRAHWLRVARETADDLATDAVAREQAGKAPFDEVSRLRESGLLTLLVPAELGGGGADWPTAYAVVRDIAAADGAIGQLLGCHYFLSWSARFLTGSPAAARLQRESATEQWCWGGGLARQEPPLTLARTSAGHLLDGRQSYATGVLVADRLAVRAVRDDTGEPLAVIVDPARHGVGVDGDDDTFGQRLAAGGSVEFDRVPVAADDVLGSLSVDEDVLSPPAALASPIGRLLSVQLRLGMAEGVLAEAREYSRAGRSPRHPSWQAGPSPDPQVLSAYGELTVLTRSASALADQAQEAVRGGLARGEDLTYDEYAETSVLVSMAEAAATRAVQESTARALDVIGTRSASSRLGFDRFWRNARTHTLYEPVAHRLRDVGDYFLNGTHPPFVLPV
ncbi:acyl-CoA dehydrogenase family protein [Streptomyces griseomycini]|uniref:Alkylation response protein AidB-like acyl-CoA dehydrogenase n=1 Tax=Streptomyces griseomycini TaxID=66895 RepID=A0A7W7PVQ0_9ACTN|nr:acyl-CoA dehydrogenase family protein [Streptomyces griseomycini]MBB4902133.1 alkylation response protein AidB-like acyl-CoA dehydrogenase [Streptomyces griseomycini]GGQ18985.1 monooxygenase [Streptomyces griseomycini]GGR37365.1 monooxygenase [Streptomyces griseomycini]